MKQFINDIRVDIGYTHISEGKSLLRAYFEVVVINIPKYYLNEACERIRSKK